MIKAVLFDYGHTLVDLARTEEALREAYTLIRKRLEEWAENQAPPEVEELVERIATGVQTMVTSSYEESRLEELDYVSLFEQAFTAIGYTLPRELLEEIIEIDHAATASVLVPAEALDVLDKLKSDGYELGLISNFAMIPKILHADMDRLGLSRRFSSITFSSDVGWRKPDPRIFVHVLRSLGVPGGRSVFVGDRLADDIAGAQAVGMKTILTTQFRQEEPGDIVPDAVVKNITEVLDVVRAWTNPRYDRAH